MSERKHRDFDEFLKAGADRFEIKPRKAAFRHISGEVRRSFLIKRWTPVAILFIAIIGTAFWNFSNQKSPELISNNKRVSKSKNNGFTPPIFFEKSSSIRSNLAPQNIWNPSITEYIDDTKVTSNIQEFSNASSLITPIDLLNLPTVLINSSRQTIFQKPQEVLYKLPKKVKTKGEWNFFVSSGYSFRRLKYINHESYNPHSFTNTDGFDWKQHAAIVGVIVGASYQRDLSKNIYIKTGGQLYMGGYDIQNKFTTYQTALSAIPAEPNEEKVRSNYRITFIEVPLLVGYKKAAKNVVYNIDGGISLATKVYQIIPEAAGLLGREYAVWNGNPRLLNLTFQLTPSINYKLFGVKMNTGLELRYQLTSTYTSSYPVKEHLYFAGLKTGIRF